jgi:hypothetical protein
MFAYVDQLIARHDEAAVAGRIASLEAERDHGCAAAQRLTQLFQSLGAHQRRIRIDDDHVIILLRQRLPGAEDRMTRAEALALDKDLDGGVFGSLLGYSVRIRSDHD